ncbi:hypothetical protein [Ignavibacterium album]|uniref:hypothetical protein n=1 Tax=Ignavibacterium album TaxID=591197 RepID=UPI0026ED3CAA|nr:hypothetical protein [Ignavibacterium album]
MKDKNKIYPYEKQINFIRLTDEAMNENLDEIKKELQEANIDIKEVQKNLLEFIKEQKARLLIEEGKLFNQDFREGKSKNTDPEVINNLVVAFRKSESGISGNNLNDDEIKSLALVKKAKNKFSGTSDEPRKKDS